MLASPLFREHDAIARHPSRERILSRKVAISLAPYRRRSDPSGPKSRKKVEKKVLRTSWPQGQQG